MILDLNSKNLKPKPKLIMKKRLPISVVVAVDLKSKLPIVV